MYKVFISERPLIIRPREGADVELKGGELHFHCSENEDIIQLISLLEDNPQVKSVHAYNNEPDVLFSTLKSHFSVVEAAGGLVQNKDGAYLFIFRRGKWDLPKGKIDKGESQEDAAVREVSEECGIPLPDLQEQLQTTYHTYEHKGKKVLKPTYWYRMYSSFEGELVPQTEEDITEVKWVAVDGLDEILANTFPNIRELIEHHILDK